MESTVLPWSCAPQELRGSLGRAGGPGTDEAPTLDPDRWLEQIVGGGCGAAWVLTEGRLDALALYEHVEGRGVRLLHLLTEGRGLGRAAELRALRALLDQGLPEGPVVAVLRYGPRPSPPEVSALLLPRGFRYHPRAAMVLRGLNSRAFASAYEARPLQRSEAPRIAELAARAYRAPWDRALAMSGDAAQDCRWVSERFFEGFWGDPVPGASVGLWQGERLVSAALVCDRPRPLLLSLTVDPGRQGQGWGWRTLEASLAGLAQAGRTELELNVWLENLPAWSLYHRAGFRILADAQGGVWFRAP